jgi:uncharacterized protein YjbI with pentapeptide repeats
MVAQWTVAHQRESLFNDKLTAASKDLAAWREVTRIVGRGRDQRVLTTREPDLVTRATAIDRLYGLIQERPSEASRIAAMLSLYVREHTVQVGDKIPDVPPVPVPTNATSDELRDWARSLQVGRSDLQKAVQALGRIRDIPKVKLEDNAIDLRHANLQAMDLSYLNFGKGQWQGAQMQGGNLRGSNFAEADMTQVKLQFTKLASTKMQFANLTMAQLNGANLFFAVLENANLTEAKLQGVLALDTQLQNSNLNEAQLHGAFLCSLELTNAKLIGTDFTGASILATNLLDSRASPRQVNPTFGDASNEFAPWPEHWPEKKLDFLEFDRAWRDWVAEYHPDVLQYLPDFVRDA